MDQSSMRSTAYREPIAWLRVYMTSGVGGGKGFDDLNGSPRVGMSGSLRLNGFHR